MILLSLAAGMPYSSWNNQNQMKCIHINRCDLVRTQFIVVRSRLTSKYREALHNRLSKLAPDVTYDGEYECHHRRPRIRIIVQITQVKILQKNNAGE